MVPEESEAEPHGVLEGLTYGEQDLPVCLELIYENSLIIIEGLLVSYSSSNSCFFSSSLADSLVLSFFLLSFENSLFFAYIATYYVFILVT
jgi:hypothetical protein